MWFVAIGSLHPQSNAALTYGYFWYPCSVLGWSSQHRCGTDIQILTFQSCLRGVGNKYHRYWSVSPQIPLEVLHLCALRGQPYVSHCGWVELSFHCQTNWRLQSPVPEPYLCRSFAGIENPISSYSTTVKPLMLAKFKLKNIKMRERKKKSQQKRKASKARTTRHQHLYWHSRINKPSKVMQSGSCLTGHRELHAKKTQKLTFGIDLL